MTVSISCPDSLVARARSGALSTSERGQLRGHLAQCESCRTTLLVGQDFDTVLAARPSDTLLIGRVAAAARAAGSKRTSIAAPAVRKATGRRWVLVGIAAALLMTSLTMAATSSWLRRALGLSSAEVPARAAEGTAPAASSSAPPVPSVSATAVPPPADDEDATAEPDLPEAASAAPSARPSAAARVASKEAESGGASAKELFAEANAKRRAGDEQGAKRLYVELQRRYPSSPEADVSRVALGRLLLERSRDPKAALAQFDGLMSQSSQAALTEEALFGRATSLMRLGRAAEERKTWLLLLERFPGSVYAERARARLGQLKGAPSAEPRTSPK